jgi:hypothetical protein
MVVKSSNATLGRIEHPFTCCDPIFNIVDNKDNLKWKVTADCCQCGIMCRDRYGKCSDVLFPIHSEIRKTEIKNILKGISKRNLMDVRN